MENKIHMEKVGKTASAVVVRLGHMGDVALTTGVLEYWRKTRGMHFIFLTKEAFTPILKNHPAIEHIYPVKADALAGTKAWLRQCSRLAREFGHLPLLDLHGTLRSRILGLRWPSPVRRYPKSGLHRRIFSRTGSPKFRSMLERTNVPQRYAMALERKAIPATELLPHIVMTASENTKALDLIHPLRKNTALVALHPYATHPAKQWPEAHWRTLIKQLEQANIDWVVVGRNKMPFFSQNIDNDLTNRTDLRTTCAILAAADVMITNDSGPMHLASGVKTPVVALFGPTAKVWGFYPAGTQDIVLEREMDCRPCSLHGATECTRGLECLSGITPDQTMAAIQTILTSR